MKFFSVVVFLILVLVSARPANAQPLAQDHRVVFEEIQQGFELGNVNVIAQHFASHVDVSLKGEESGYYSANHTFYILEKYLKERKVMSFELVNVSEAEATPFATGGGVFIHKGTRETVQVYIALMDGGEKWVIARINIY